MQTLFLHNLPLEIVLLIINAMPAASTLKLRQCSKFFNEITERDKQFIISNKMKDEFPMLWKLVERHPRPRKMPQEFADSTLRMVVATNMGVYCGIPPPGHIMTHFAPYDTILFEGRGLEVIEFHAYDIKSNFGPVHTHRFVPYINPWKAEENIKRFEAINEVVLKREWKYLALMDHVQHKITAAALEIQDAVVPEEYLMGQDRSQWVFNGMYLQWYADLKEYYHNHGLLGDRIIYGPENWGKLVEIGAFFDEKSDYAHFYKFSNVLEYFTRCMRRKNLYLQNNPHRTDLIYDEFQLPSSGALLRFRDSGVRWDQFYPCHWQYIKAYKLEYEDQPRVTPLYQAHHEEQQHLRCWNGCPPHRDSWDAEGLILLSRWNSKDDGEEMEMEDGVCSTDDDELEEDEDMYDEADEYEESNQVSGARKRFQASRSSKGRDAGTRRLSKK
ncbi:hypothetical protein MMC18_008746 [Xylographa bjoerkii]|nr:hypothetical protein [Xylographa bjoerkii]